MKVMDIEEENFGKFKSFHLQNQLKMKVSAKSCEIKNSENASL